MSFRNLHARPRRSLNSLPAKAFRALLAAGLLAAALGCVSSAARLVPVAGAQGERREGQWLVEHDAAENKTHFTLRYESRKYGPEGKTSHSSWSTGFNVELNRLQGLTREQLMSAGGTQARFQLKRDAGAFDCEGWVRAGKGSGHFVFTPDRNFAAELQRRGVGSPTDEQLFTLAMSDAGLALLDELKAQGYEQPTLEQFVRMNSRGVRLDYVRGLGALGYRLGSVDKLIRMRDHGVSLAYVRELSEAGYRNLSAEELVRIRSHGVSTTFLREMKAEGYGGLTLEQLVRLRSHGVSARYVRDLKELGYARLSAEQLVRLRSHGVTAAFVRRAKAESGEAAPTVDELIWMRARGLTGTGKDKHKEKDKPEDRQ